KIIEKQKYRIAVLDDDETIVHNITGILGTDKYIVKGFFDIEILEQSISKEPYDAYILDWVVGSSTVFNTIKMIRHSKKTNSMILVLTGQLSIILDKEISSAINEFDIIGPYEKPIKASLIKSNIDKFFPEN
ncbi:Response regulator receiver domain-containing protein, partial [Serratia sp. JKS296]